MANWKALILGCVLITGLLAGCSGTASPSQQGGPSSAAAVHQASLANKDTLNNNSKTPSSETQPGKMVKPEQFSQPQANAKTMEPKKTSVAGFAAGHTTAAVTPAGPPASTATAQAKEHNESSNAAKQVAQAPASHSETAPVSAHVKPVVTLQIIGNKQHQAILAAQPVLVKEGDTVLDILTRSLKQNNMQYEYSGALSTAYIKGIDNLYEFDDGPKSGWMFKVNGMFSDKSAGSYRVKAGDSIVWMYTIDSGKDIGAR